MPVHPVLAAMLAEWKLQGWPEMMGRTPEPDDLVVPLPRKPQGIGRDNLDRHDTREHRHLRGTHVSLSASCPLNRAATTWAVPIRPC
jgi:hypothetical protein